MGSPPDRYRGRFAPTPSGPLHVGSIVAAAGSYVDALAQGGEWHLRIDDLDPPRVVPGAEAAILATLEALGFEWTGPVIRQSLRRDAYAAAFDRLLALGMLYPCGCTRAEIAAAGLAGSDGPRYPGTCRAGPKHPDRPAAWRLRVDDHPVDCDDLLQGSWRESVALTTGDFVVRRADGVYAYHLACVVDDAAGGFDPIVRGADLLDSVARQRTIQRALGLPVPRHLHLPVATDAAGNKLSKQTLAPGVMPDRPAALIAQTLCFLGHTPPAELAHGRVDALWAWARAAWNRQRVPAVRAQPWKDSGPARNP